MANEETPGWAQRLLLEVTDPNDSFERRFDELSNLMKDLKKKKRHGPSSVELPMQKRELEI